MATLLIIRRGRGSLAKLAEELGLTRGAVAKWDRVPAERVVEVERITGIPREQLRPDLYRQPLDAIHIAETQPARAA
ncbi:transcriptional regulator [Rhodopila sp.]|uniref:transcriptional regulator n=1 Tax=Rhodopila sp. TaxID=2480087 RepID=UPI003D0AB91B